MDDPSLSDEEQGFRNDSCSEDEGHVCSEHTLRRLSGRKLSEAQWSGGGLAEVVRRRGKLWVTTGVMRRSKLFCNIEEVAFLVHREALKLVQRDGSIMSLMDLYGLLATGKCGCSWNEYQVYFHLKSLGYIVGRHKVPWTDSVKRVTGVHEKDPNESYKKVIKEIPEVESRSVAVAEVTDFVQGRVKAVDGDSFCNSFQYWIESGLSEMMTDQLAIIDKRGAGTDHLTLGLQRDCSECLKLSEDEVAGSRGKEISVYPHRHPGSNLTRMGAAYIHTDGFGSSEKLSMHVHNDMSDLYAPTQPFALDTVSLDMNAPIGYSWSDVSNRDSCQEIKLMFDVHLPNSRFRKTDPGVPAFSLCVKRFISTTSNTTPVHTCACAHRGESSWLKSDFHILHDF
eukprot:c28158_g1_i8 orf=69-1256(-)